MITFKEFIAEAQSTHESYKQWGAMKHSGALVSGNDHTFAQTHADLGDHGIHFAQERAHQFERGYRDSSFGDLDDKRARPLTLNIRTDGPKALKTALKHFDKFPHVEGRKVSWDHYRGEEGVPYSTSGDSGVVYGDMSDHSKAKKKP